MITEKKVVLVVKDKRTMEGIKYEAIEVITDAKSVLEVWRCNKTPAILEKHSTEVKNRYPWIMLPEFISRPEQFISFCHENGFECGEFISGRKFDTSKDSCFLCSIGKHMNRSGKFANITIPLPLYNQTTAEINDIILYDSEHFYVKIEYGCMAKGMLMICPKEHYLSAARIPDEHMEEYEQVKRDIEFLLKAIYGNKPVIFFEHGSSPSGISSHERSIVHAHTHVAWGISFEQEYKDMVCLQEVKDIKALRNTKYFSYQEGADGKLLAVWDPKVYVQRQYPRQIIGLKLGLSNEQTNWRKMTFMENIIATFDDFYYYLETKQSFLCERIVLATDGFVSSYNLRYDH